MFFFNILTPKIFPHFERCARILMLLHIGAHLPYCFVLVSKELILPIICFVHTFLEIQYHHNFLTKSYFFGYSLIKKPFCCYFFDKVKEVHLKGLGKILFRRKIFWGRYQKNILTWFLE